jgi:hypothetical protein
MLIRKATASHARGSHHGYGELALAEDVLALLKVRGMYHEPVGECKRIGGGTFDIKAAPGWLIAELMHHNAAYLPPACGGCGLRSYPPRFSNWALGGSLYCVGGALYCIDCGGGGRAPARGPLGREL